MPDIHVHDPRLRRSVRSYDLAVLVEVPRSNIVSPKISRPIIYGLIMEFSSYPNPAFLTKGQLQQEGWSLCQQLLNYFCCLLLLMLSYAMSLKKKIKKRRVKQWKLDFWQFKFPGKIPYIFRHIFDKCCQKKKKKKGGGSFGEKLWKIGCALLKRGSLGESELKKGGQCGKLPLPLIKIYFVCHCKCSWEILKRAGFARRQTAWIVADHRAVPYSQLSR